MPARPLLTYVVTQPGLEALAAAELRALGLKGPRVAHGGLTVRMNNAELYAANLHLRTASRVLLRVADGKAENFAELTSLVRSVPWHRWLRTGVGPADVKVTCTHSRLHHSGAVTERVLDLLGPLGGAAVHIRIVEDSAVLSIDSSGDHLHRRGWRLETAKAPLRETLAAALLQVAGWTPDRPIYDPMCGSGTIVIEAAQMAAGIPAGWNRHFAFQDWPGFHPEVWERVRSAVGPPRPLRPGVTFTGSDRDAGAIAAAQANAERAGVVDSVQFLAVPISQAKPPTNALIVTNPPYGVRVGGGGDPRNLYASLGQLSRGHELAVIAADSALLAHIRPGLVVQAQTTNGGIPVRLVTG